MDGKMPSIGLLRLPTEMLCAFHPRCHHQVDSRQGPSLYTRKSEGLSNIDFLKIFSPQSDVFCSNNAVSFVCNPFFALY